MPTPREGVGFPKRRVPKHREFGTSFAAAPREEEGEKEDEGEQQDDSGVVELGRFPSLGLLRAAGEEDERIVQHALECMQLLPLQERPISQLSGGQQQRTFLARALAQQAHVLLLDEPFTGLDIPGVRALGDLLHRMAREEGRLVIAACHDTPEEIARVFDHALLLDAGEQLFFGPCAQLLSAPAPSSPSPAA